MSVFKHSSSYFLPVTALQYVSFKGKDILLAGSGPFLRILSSENGTVLSQIEALPSQRIHGICLGKDVSNDLNVLVYGRNSFRWISFNGDITLSNLSEIYKVKDWILDIYSISFESIRCFVLAIGLAHNAVMLFSPSSKSSLFVSEINCLLYSIHVVFTAGNLVVASGTVFNDILLWSLQMSHDSTSLCKVALTLKGHEGVIFCVQFNDNHSRLASVSDDRSIRIWDLPLDWEKKRDVVCSCSSVVAYGHTSRIWKIIWTSYYLVSIGEDATCRVWDHHGKCQDVILGHKGCNIWSVTFDKLNSVVFTGGADCSIRAYKIRTEDKVTVSSVVTVLDHIEKCVPRTLVLWQDYLLFALSDNGSLYKMDLTYNLKWSLCHTDQRFSNYCMMSIAKRLPLLAIGNLDGVVKILVLPAAAEGYAEVRYEWKCHNGKVFSLIWISEDNDDRSTELLLSCGPDGTMICWCVSHDTNHVVTVSLFLHLILPPSKHRWVSACVVKRIDKDRIILICGDRKGSIHVYNCPLSSGLQDESFNSCQSIYGVHGPNGVTGLTLWEDSLYSVGRDGYCRRYLFVNKENNILEEMYKFHPVNGMEWIQEIAFTTKLGLLTSGFHGNEFVLHSSKASRTIFKTICGGGHRSCVLSSPDTMMDTGKLTVSYIKGPNVIILQEDLSNQFYCPVLQESFMGHIAVSICLLKELGSTVLVAIGSEDCSIELVSIGNSSDNSLPSLKKIGSLEGHTSMVHSLSSVINDDSVLLFSGGGRASLKAWLINTKTEKDLLSSLQCEYNLHNLPFKPQRRKGHCLPPPPECRVMSLDSFLLKNYKWLPPLHDSNLVCVVAGCSDGVIRIYIYNQTMKCFTLVKAITHHDRCILCVSCILLTFTDNELILLVSAATDGQLVCWELSSLLETWFNKEDIVTSPLPPPLITKPLLLINAHQSGINDVAVSMKRCSSSQINFLMASVGDDTALILTQCCVTCDVQVTIVKQMVVPNAHYSSVIGVSFLPSNSNYILTTSSDQRLSLWSITDEAILKENEHIHDVVDPSCLLSFSMKDSSSSSCCCTVVCGVDMVPLTDKRIVRLSLSSDNAQPAFYDYLCTIIN